MILLLLYIEDKYIPQKNSALSFDIFTGISVSRTALLDFSFLISLSTVFLSTGEKLKLEKRWETLFMTRMLGGFCILV